VTLGDERTTVADDVTVGAQLPLPTPAGKVLTAVGNGWPGFVTAKDEEEGDDATAAACCDEGGKHITAILSTGRTVGPVLINTLAVGGALYRLDGVGARTAWASTDIP